VLEGKARNMDRKRPGMPDRRILALFSSLPSVCAI